LDGPVLGAAGLRDESRLAAGAGKNIAGGGGGEAGDKQQQKEQKAAHGGSIARVMAKW
jgi:hypothetical protein